MAVANTVGLDARYNVVVRSFGCNAVARSFDHNAVGHSTLDLGIAVDTDQGNHGNLREVGNLLVESYKAVRFLL